MRKGKLIVFSAPSGSGKTTLVKHLIKHHPNLGFSISATSRAPRGQEVDGKDYYFLSQKEFSQKIANNTFLEFEEVYQGVFYGTLKTEVERLWEEGNHVLFDIDVQGGLNIKSKYPKQTLAIFVQPPSLEELEKRLRNRGTESEAKIQQRLEKSTSELAYSKDFDVTVINDDLEKAKEEVLRLVQEFVGS